MGLGSLLYSHRQKHCDDSNNSCEGDQVFEAAAPTSEMLDCMDFEPCFKVHSLVSVYPRSIKLGQMTTLNVIVSVINWIKFETCPGFLHNNIILECPIYKDISCAQQNFKEFGILSRYKKPFCQTSIKELGKIGVFRRRI